MFSSIYYIYSRFFKKYLRGKSIKNCVIDKTAVILSGSQVIDSNIGRYTNSGYDCQILCCNIGNFCSLASNVVIGSAEHPIEWVSISPIFEDINNSGSAVRFARHSLPVPKRTIIGNDVWIGYGAIIKAGVTIGTGAVIGSGAVVTKDVPPYTIVGGCPARLIRLRFKEEIIDRLLQSEWWKLSDEQIKRVAPFVPNPELFLEEIEKIK